MAGYGTDQLFEQWLTANGHTLPVSAPSPAILRLRASNYIDGLYEARFFGDRTDPLSQERAWPRTGAVVQRVAIPSDLIPPAIEKAAYAAALFEAENPGALFVSASSAGAIKRERVDVLETEYFQGTGDAAADATIKLSAVEGLLSPFLRPVVTGTSLGLWAV